jgi:hypothetical protein
MVHVNGLKQGSPTTSSALLFELTCVMIMWGCAVYVACVAQQSMSMFVLCAVPPLASVAYYWAERVQLPWMGWRPWLWAVCIATTVGTVLVVYYFTSLTAGWLLAACFPALVSIGTVVGLAYRERSHKTWKRGRGQTVGGPKRGQSHDERLANEEWLRGLEEEVEEVAKQKAKEKKTKEAAAVAARVAKQEAKEKKIKEAAAVANKFAFELDNVVGLLCNLSINDCVDDLADWLCELRV